MPTPRNNCSSTDGNDSKVLFGREIRRTCLPRKYEVSLETLQSNKFQVCYWVLFCRKASRSYCKKNDNITGGKMSSTYPCSVSVLEMWVWLSKEMTLQIITLFMGQGRIPPVFDVSKHFCGSHQDTVGNGTMNPCSLIGYGTTLNGLDGVQA